MLLDADAGTVEVSPTPARARAAQERRRQARERALQARARAHETGRTRDGTRIEVFANLGAAAQAPGAVELGAEGVGLLRTEFLFLERSELPGEDEQTQTLVEIATALDGRPLIVRTLDAGADKPLPALPMPAEANPFLGVRGIRLGLARPEVLEIAVPRDPAGGRALPGARDVADGRHRRGDRGRPARSWTARVRHRHRRASTARDHGRDSQPPRCGPHELAAHAEFFSIGTNDLTQYTMAAERGDERLAALLTGAQPAVLRLIAADRRGRGGAGRTVGVCGELAGDPAVALLLVGLGVTELSMTPALVPEVKAALRGVDLASARQAAQAALSAEDAAAAHAAGAALL